MGGGDKILGNCPPSEGRIFRGGGDFLLHQISSQVQPLSKWKFAMPSMNSLFTILPNPPSVQKGSVMKRAATTTHTTHQAISINGTAPSLLSRSSQQAEGHACRVFLVGTGILNIFYMQECFPRFKICQWWTVNKIISLLL